MIERVLSLALGATMALALSACESEAPAPEPTPAATAQPTQAAERPVMGPERRILAFGDSLFAGYNVGEDESYPARLEVALRSRGINARVANAGVSGDTSAAGLQRFVFTLDAQERKPELVILELGGNDLLRGVSPAETRANLSKMLAELQQREIPAILFGMRAPPNLGDAFVRDFDGLYRDLAAQYDVPLVPFFLEAIYDKPEYIQPDRIHPTARGIEELVAATSGEVAEALPEPDA